MFMAHDIDTKGQQGKGTLLHLTWVLMDFLPACQEGNLDLPCIVVHWYCSNIFTIQAGSLSYPPRRSTTFGTLKPMCPGRGLFEEHLLSKPSDKFTCTGCCLTRGEQTDPILRQLLTLPQDCTDFPCAAPEQFNMSAVNN